MHSQSLIILVAALFIYADGESSHSLVLESARSNENFMRGGEFISVLRGDVTFSYDDIRIRADEATWTRHAGTVQFRRNVKVTREDEVITCDRMNFSKENSSLFAYGDFDYFDSTDRSRLRGQEAEYNFTAKTFRIKGEPVLIRYDTARGETLTISSIFMSYVDSLKRATAVDSVRIDKGVLHSTCQAAHYYTSTSQALLRGSPRVVYETHEVTGDSIDLDFSGDALRSASVVGNSHGVYTDTAGFDGADTGYTHIWGDSLFLSISDSSRLESLWSVGKASSKSFQVSDTGATNTASGKIMKLGFSHSGEVEELKIWESAKSTYFIDDAGRRGKNEVSGDSIAVTFAGGKARFVALSGSTRGKYMPVR